MINNYLREGNKYGLSAREIQMAYALNRTQFEPILTAKLAQGINIIAEDYVGTVPGIMGALPVISRDP